MKIKLFNVDEFIRVNELEEVTSPTLFERGDIPASKGLVSNEIFGTTPKSRRDTFAYIDLHGHFFNPHIYKVVKAVFRNVEKIIDGSKYFNIDENGYLVEAKDGNGYTGIDWLYNNWSKIKWKDPNPGGIRSERIELLTNTKKDIVFITKMIVIPAYYRDIRLKKNGSSETDDVNKMYVALIRYASFIENKDLFDVSLSNFDTSNANMQNTIVKIYEYFRDKLKSKNGIIRKSLLGRNVDFCARTVITAAVYHDNSPDNMKISYEYSSIPIAEICALCYPFMEKYVKDFFTREFIDNTSCTVYDPATNRVIGDIKLDDPVSYFDDRYVKKVINMFMKDPESRFNKIVVPVEGDKIMYAAFTGKRYSADNTAEINTTSARPMTITDLLYMAAVDVTKDKHALSTRYPVLTEFGTFVTKIKVSSTIKTAPAMINGQVYPDYPVIDFNVPKHEIGSLFIDSFRFSNGYLKGIEGDYDGDTMIIKIMFTQEANQECENYMYTKQNFLDASGKNIRTIGKEAYQTFFVMTKDPTENSKVITDTDAKYYMSINPSEITLEQLIDIFGNLTTIDNKGGNAVKSKYEVNDIIYLPKEYMDKFSSVTGDNTVTSKGFKTTLGRLFFNKILVERLGFESVTGYRNIVHTAGNYKKFENVITDALKEDKINTKQFIKYLDTRDWFGLEMHAVITTSFSPTIIKVPKEIKDLKKKLVEENKEGIANGDPLVAEKIEKQLINKEMEYIKGDYGADLYISGARGSVGNHLKNMMLMRGAVYNSATEKYEIITNSMYDGLDKKDYAAHSNTIVQGGYAKSKETGSTGYLTKELIAATQMERIDEDPNSDCGTKKTLDITIPSYGTTDFLYRYIVENGKLVELTKDNIGSYVGKKVKLRSPMYCKGTQSQHCMCAKCFGTYYYKIGKTNVGLLSAVLGGSLTQGQLQKFHQNLISSKQLDIDDMLI